MRQDHIDHRTGIQKRRGAVRPINERIARLREESVNAQVKISTERARLVTEFYQSGVADNLSIPVQRAMAFKYLLEHCSLPVEEGQLIVGLRGTGPKEVPTYPEICAHSLEDLDILDTRENMPYHNTAEDKQLYESTILPFWQGKTIRESCSNACPRSGYSATKRVFGQSLWNSAHRVTLLVASVSSKRAFWILRKK